MEAVNYDPFGAMRHLRARLQAAGLRQFFKEDVAEKQAEALLKAGFTTIIPSDHLLEGEVLVSQQVYNAVKQMVKDK